MGARLVSQVLGRWSHLSDRAFRVLVRMALTALDEGTETAPAATYFAGRDPLAAVLRNERGGTRDSVLRVVRFAIDELIEDGAIERASKGRAGKKAVYRLTLLNPPKSIAAHHCNTASQGESSVPPEGESSVPPQGESSVPEWGNVAFPPRNHDEPREDGWEEIRLPVLPVVSAVDTTGGAPPPDPRRPQTPSAPGHESETSTSYDGGLPPQPETATHPRASAREDQAEPAATPHLRLIDGGEQPIPAPAPVRRGWSTRGQDTIAAAQARRAAAVAAHQAAMAAARGDDPA